MRFGAGEADEPPALLLLRDPNRDWPEESLRAHAAEMRGFAATAVLTASQRRRCLRNAARAEQFIEESLPHARG